MGAQRHHRHPGPRPSDLLSNWLIASVLLGAGDGAYFLRVRDLATLKRELRDVLGGPSRGSPILSTIASSTGGVSPTQPTY